MKTVKHDFCVRISHRHRFLRVIELVTSAVFSLLLKDFSSLSLHARLFKILKFTKKNEHKRLDTEYAQNIQFKNARKWNVSYSGKIIFSLSYNTIWNWVSWAKSFRFTKKWSCSPATLKQCGSLAELVQIIALLPIYRVGKLFLSLNIIFCVFSVWFRERGDSPHLFSWKLNMTIHILHDSFSWKILIRHPVMLLHIENTVASERSAAQKKNRYQDRMRRKEHLKHNLSISYVF